MGKSKKQKLAETLLTNSSEAAGAGTSAQALQTVTVTAYQVIVWVLQVANTLLMGVAYILLVFQTVYVLQTKEPKYINLRHVALKWLIALCLYQIKRGFASSPQLNSHLAIILLDLAIIAIAYPSRALKAVHLKYFSHKQQQRYQESVVDPNKYDLSFGGRITVSVTVVLLTLCQHLIALVQPQHRRPIEEALKTINAVVIDRKCFWSIYKSAGGEQEILDREKAATKEYLVSGSTTVLQGTAPAGSSTYIQLPTPRKEHLEVIKAFGEKCNVRSTGFKPLKKVGITYTTATSELEVLDIDLGRTETYTLQELTEKEDNIVEFLVTGADTKQPQPLYIKFRSSRELFLFMKGLEEAEKAF